MLYYLWAVTDCICYCVYFTYLCFILSVFLSCSRCVFCE